MLSFKELFYSSTQARWMGVAIICAIIAICLSVLFNNTELELGERFALIAVVILFSIPAVFLSLFELNCIAVKNKSHNWCGYWAWFIFTIIAIQCVFIIVSALMSMITYNEASNKVEKYKEKVKMESGDANKIAKDMIDGNKENTDMKVMDTNMMSGDSMMGYGMPTEYMPLKMEQFKNKKKVEQFKNKKQKEEVVEAFVGGEFSSSAF
tara:strand:+ start:20366 stop:20992 length:627 start_codon:yes stop_codon:yes gene_type:complete